MHAFSLQVGNICTYMLRRIFRFTFRINLLINITYDYRIVFFLISTLVPYPIHPIMSLIFEPDLHGVPTLSQVNKPKLIGTIKLYFKKFIYIKNQLNRISISYSTVLNK